MTDWRVYLAWGMALCLALLGPLLPVLSLPAAAGGLLLVVVPPWASAVDVVDAAGGRPIGPEQSPFGLFATSDAQDFPDRLRDAGAWAVLDGTAVSTLCGWKIS